MAQVLIIEDDELIAALERDFFKNSNFDVTVARDAKSGMKALSQTAVDAVILDVGLPDEDGFTVCQKLREKSDVPILFVTAHTSDEDKIKGLGLGADDYIV